jgi:hypothetical protein
MLRVEWVTVQVRWRNSRVGGVKVGVAESSDEEEEEVSRYLEGRRRVMGGGWEVVGSAMVSLQRGFPSVQLLWLLLKLV